MCEYDLLIKDMASIFFRILFVVSISFYFIILFAGQLTGWTNKLKKKFLMEKSEKS